MTEVLKTLSFFVNVNLFCYGYRRLCFVERFKNPMQSRRLFIARQTFWIETPVPLPLFQDRRYARNRQALSEALWDLL